MESAHLLAQLRQLGQSESIRNARKLLPVGVNYKRSLKVTGVGDPLS